jgi:predicted nucleic acid-binding protein
MEPQYLLDSNAVIDFLSGVLPDAGMVLCSDIVNAVPRLSAMSKIELLRFVLAPSNEQILDDFINESEVLPIDGDVINETIRLCKGNKMKIPDAVIAATCLIHHLILVTRNIKDFKHIDEIKIVNPWDLQQRR